MTARITHRLSAALRACLLTVTVAAASCSSDASSADPAIVAPGAGGAQAAAGAPDETAGHAGSAGGLAGGPQGGFAGASQGGFAGAPRGGAAGAPQGGGAGIGGHAGGTQLPTECPTEAPGAKMIRVEGPQGRAACIDQREVTQGEYHAFVAAVGVEGYQAMGYCKNSGTSSAQTDAYLRPEPTYGPPYAPQGTPDFKIYGICAYGYYQPDATPDAAAGCLVPCQAQSYCAWAGKELCGRFDSEEPLDETSSIDPTQSVWAAACTNGGKTVYSHASKEPDPCGPSWPPSGNAVTDARPEAHPACHGEGALSEVFNLSGGVGEFINARTTATDTILSGPIAMGPAPHMAAAGSGCEQNPTGTPAWSVGFRCCKRLAPP